MLLTVGLLAYYGFQGRIYFLAFNDLDTSNSQISQFERQIAGTFPAHETLEEELGTRNGILREWTSVFSYEGYPKTDGLLATIFATAQENGIRLSSLALGDSGSQVDELLEYQTQLVDINLSAASHGDIFSFLSELHQKIPSVRVVEITLVGFEGSPSAEALLLFYLAPEPPSEEEE